ncbi:hypothetical protein [Endozoicomonas numazuensis]|nr:hypothetical protein [Endozoicomonas numazuensis]
MSQEKIRQGKQSASDVEPLLLSGLLKHTLNPVVLQAREEKAQKSILC